jgi:hypothetical protein
MSFLCPSLLVLVGFAILVLLTLLAKRTIFVGEKNGGGEIRNSLHSNVFVHEDLHLNFSGNERPQIGKSENPTPQNGATRGARAGG